MKKSITLFFILMSLSLFADTQIGDKFRDAVYFDQPDQVAQLLANGMEPNTILETTYGTDMVPVKFATRSGSSKIVAILAEAGAELTFDLFRIALLNEDRQMVETLVSSGLDINTHDYYTILGMAVSFQQYEMVEFIISLGANPEIGTVSQVGTNTALQIAVNNNDLKMVRLLIDLGSDVNNKADSVYTPLKHALHDKNYPMMTLLVELGASLEKQPDEVGYTILENAVADNNTTAIRLLVELGAKIDDGFLNNPLLTAIFLGHLDSVKVLIEVGASPVSDRYQIAPLYKAISNDRLSIAYFLFSQGAELPKHGDHYMVEAIKNENPLMVQLLINHNINITRASLKAAKKTKNGEIIDMIKKYRRSQSKIFQYFKKITSKQ